MLAYSLLPPGETATEVTAPADELICLMTWCVLGSTTATLLPAATYRYPPDPLASTPSGVADS